MSHMRLVDSDMSLDMYLQLQGAISPRVLDSFCQAYHLWTCCLDASELARKAYAIGLFLAYLQSLDIMFRHTPKEERGKWTVVSALNPKQPASLAHRCKLSCPRWPGSANTGEPGLFSGWDLQAPGVFIEGSSKSATERDGWEEVSSTQWRQLMEKSRFHSSVLLQTHRLPAMKIYFGLYR